MVGHEHAWVLCTAHQVRRPTCPTAYTRCWGGFFPDTSTSSAPPGSGPFSMVRWNPFGRYFVLAGFGNLPGDLAFYDKKADGKCKPMGTTR